MNSFLFTVDAVVKNSRARAGVLATPSGNIETPAFAAVGTKATVKALSPEQVNSIGAQVVLANTYHLYFQPGDETIRKAGGIQKFMNWQKPTMTDSGGFQAFSLGAAYGSTVSKIASSHEDTTTYLSEENIKPPAEITEQGVSFRSPFDGGAHLFTPERSIQIQHNIGADIMFAFDECTSPHAPYNYQKEAMERTHRWAKRSLEEHKCLIGKEQNSKLAALFGIVQGGRHEDLRRESARIIGAMDFDGFGIGGSFNKDDMHGVVGWVNDILPNDKPRHLLGIGEPRDLFGGVENGCDLFDCVAPTRIARTGTLYTKEGTINILNARFREDFTSIEDDCKCYTCINFTRAYIAHLFRAKEMFGSTLASIHNLFFIVHLVDRMRESIHMGNFEKYKKEFLDAYYH